MDTEKIYDGAKNKEGKYDAIKARGNMLKMREQSVMGKKKKPGGKKI